MFNKADLGHDGQAGGDGKVTFDEIVANVDGVDGSDADQALFNVVDADNDGFVTLDEFKQFAQYYLIQQMGANSGSQEQVSAAHIAEAIRSRILSGRR